MRLARGLVAWGVLCGALLLLLPAAPAGAIPIFPGNPGPLQATFDNTGLPGFNTGPAAAGVGAFRMDTGAGSGGTAGGKVYLRSTELDGQPVTNLTGFTFQYFIDTTSPVALTPYANLRVDSPNFVPAGARTLTTDTPPGVQGAFTTVTVPTGPTPGWVVTGAQITCGGTPFPSGSSLEVLAATCADTNIVATSGGLLGGVAIVTGVSNGVGWVGWTGVIDDVNINANQYDLEPARITVTPASPVTLATRDPQTVTFTLQASGWNSFLGLDLTGLIPIPIVRGHEMSVGFRATGATTVTGLAGTVPVAPSVADLSAPPPPVTFTLDVTATLIGSVATIAVDWVTPPDGTSPGLALNAVTDPATTVLQLPPVPTTTTTSATAGPSTTASRVTIAATGAGQATAPMAWSGAVAVVVGTALVLASRRRIRRFPSSRT